MEEIKNVIVKQHDIMDILNSLNSYFVEKQKVFDETERLVFEEEDRYKEWNDARYKSESFASYPEFNRSIFQNKKITAMFNVSIGYVDGSTVENASVDEFHHAVATFGFEKMNSIKINMSLSYYSEYKADDYSFNPNNRVSQDVYIHFQEDNIYYNVSGENCNAIVTDLKNIILDKFSSLEPRLSNLITKRKISKYFATLYRSFIASLILTVLLAVAVKEYVSVFDLDKYWYLCIAVYVVLGFVLNVIMPSARLSRLYKLIIPKQKEEYSRYDKAYHKVDNLKDFVAYPEIQIGANAKKAGVRETIKKILKKSKIKGIIAFVAGLAIVTAVAMFVI